MQDETIHPLTIVGAGPAGLYLSALLSKNSIPHILVDQAGEISGIGFGILLQDSIFHCLSLLGIDKEDVGVTGTHELKIFKNDDKELDAIHIEDPPVYSARRGALLEALASKVDQNLLHTKKELSSVEKYRNFSILKFSDGSIIKTKYVIGADGIKSMVRKSIFIEDATSNVYSAFYFWIKNTGEKMIKIYPDNGINVLILPTERDEDVLFITTNKKLTTEGKTNEQLCREVLSPNTPFLEHLISQIEFEKPSLLTIVRRTKKFRFANEASALIGDAAHGETPTLGWGTTIAIEDACVLGDQLSKYRDDYPKAFEGYYNLRKKRVAVLHHLTTVQELFFGIYSKQENFLRNILLFFAKPFASYFYNHIRRLYKKLYTYTLS